MRVKVIIPSADFPVTLEEAKHQLGYFHSEDDKQVKELLIDATHEAQTYCSLQGLFATVEEKLDCFPAGNIYLAGLPFVKVESITYQDLAGETQTLDPATYQVGTVGTYARLKPNSNWPSTKDILGAVSVKYVVGHAQVTTATAETNLFTQEAHPFTNGQRVVVFGAMTASLPTNLRERKTYFIINATADTFQLATTAGGAALSISSAGSGTWYVGPSEIPRQLKRAILMAIASYDQFRSDSVTGTMVTSLPMNSRYYLDQIKPLARPPLNN